MRRKALKALPFLAVLLLAVFTAAVLAPSAMTKKPAAPSGVFTVQPGGSMTLSGMTLKSEHNIAAYVCAWGPDGQLIGFQLLGDNSGAPGQEIQLDPWTSGPTSFPVTVRLLLADETSVKGYTSDTSSTPVNFGDGNFSSVPGHATVAWVDAQVLVSINDGSENPTGVSLPVLGAGNFNATVGVTAPAWPVTITNITGYSDGPIVDQNNNKWCLFHAEFSYQGKLRKTVQATAATHFVKAYSQTSLSWVQTSLGASPFSPGTLTLAPADLVAGTDYQFYAVIEDSANNKLGVQYGALFTIDPSTDFVDGCPAPGVLVSTDFGS